MIIELVSIGDLFDSFMNYSIKCTIDNILIDMEYIIILPQFEASDFYIE